MSINNFKKKKNKKQLTEARSGNRKSKVYDISPFTVLDPNYQKSCTVFSRSNAPGEYLKIGSFDRAFFQGRRLLVKCNFYHLFRLFFSDPRRRPRGSLSGQRFRPVPGSLKMITVRTHYPKLQSVMVPYLRCVYHVLKKKKKQRKNNIGASKWYE